MDEILKGFDSLATMIAARVTEDLKREFSQLLSGTERSQNGAQEKKYVRGNKALAEYLGVSPLTVCEWKGKGILNDAIKAEYGRVIIYDVEKVLASLKHKTLKAGRPRIKNA